MENSDPPGSDGLPWRVSRYCASGECVRVAPTAEMVILGDSKNPSGPVLSYTKSEWNSFISRARLGEFDNL
jgi:Domain of unknown function (DUF397)